MESISIVSVITNSAQYKQLFTENRFLSKTTLYPYDNSQQNLSIPTRYNHFIEHIMPQNSWIVFCHQDFEFLQDPHEVLDKLDKNCIYGPIGVAQYKRRFLVSYLRHGWKPTIRLRQTIYPKYLGQIIQGSSSKDFKIGQKITYPKTVDTIDCCCLIVHSSLIRAKNLRFDEQFNFHLYSEDFSLSASEKHIKTKVIQIKCKHYSEGKINELFWQKYRQLLAKYPTKFFFTTCVSNHSLIAQQTKLGFPLKVLFYKGKDI